MTQLKTVKAILFDMDGTLVDNIPFHQQAWLHFLENHGILLQPADFHAQNHGTIQEMISRFFPHEKSFERRAELGEEKEATYRQLYQPHLKEVEGLSPFLQKLQNSGISCHLATMGDQNNIDFTLDGLGIRSYFQSITGGHEVGKGKPDPEIFLRILMKTGLKKEECLVIEDSGGGVRSALAAGLQVIGMATTHEPYELTEMGCVDALMDFTRLHQELQ